MRPRIITGLVAALAISVAAPVQAAPGPGGGGRIPDPPPIVGGQVVLPGTSDTPILVHDGTSQITPPEGQILVSGPLGGYLLSKEDAQRFTAKIAPSTQIATRSDLFNSYPKDVVAKAKWDRDMSHIAPDTLDIYRKNLRELAAGLAVVSDEKTPKLSSDRKSSAESVRTMLYSDDAFRRLLVDSGLTVRLDRKVEEEIAALRKKDYGVWASFRGQRDKDIRSAAGKAPVPTAAWQVVEARRLADHLGDKAGDTKKNADRGVRAGSAEDVKKALRSTEMASRTLAAYYREDRSEIERAAKSERGAAFAAALDGLTAEETLVVPNVRLGMNDVLAAVLEVRLQGVGLTEPQSW